MRRRPVRLTFTGVDQWTNLYDLMVLGRLHPQVEFAVLVGSGTGSVGGKPRYPP